MSKGDDYFIARLLGFLASIHDCHICNFPCEFVSGRNGKSRVYCTKYGLPGLPIKRVRWNCIDRFGGFNGAEIQELKKQRKAGRCKLVIDGVTI